MNDKRDMAPLVWGYIKSRETARRMGSYAGEVTAMHPQFAFNSSARAQDMDLATTKAYAGSKHISAGIQHGMSSFLPGQVSRSANQMNIGSWTTPLEAGKQPSASTLNSNRHEARPSLEYSDDDIKHIEKWSKCQVL